MVFWTGIVVGGFFIWLAVRMGFYETWALLFIVVISVYALTLTTIAVGTFLILHGISYTFLTGQFNVSFPKIFDNLGAGVLGFLAGFLIWSFAALLISATPIGQKCFARAIGFGPEIQQTNGSYICWWCNLVSTAVSAKDNRQQAQETVSRLLEKAEEEIPDTPERDGPNNPTPTTQPSPG